MWKTTHARARVNECRTFRCWADSAAKVGGDGALVLPPGVRASTLGVVGVDLGTCLLGRCEIGDEGWWWVRHQLCQAPKVLGDCRQRELVLCAARTP